MSRRPATVEDAVGWGCVLLVFAAIALGVVALLGSVWIAGR